MEVSPAASILSTEYNIVSPTTLERAFDAPTEMNLGSEVCDRCLLELKSSYQATKLLCI